MDVLVIINWNTITISPRNISRLSFTNRTIARKEDRDPAPRFVSGMQSVKHSPSKPKAEAPRKAAFCENRSTSQPPNNIPKIFPNALIKLHREMICGVCSRS